MTNYENQKIEIDALFERNKYFAVDISTKKVVPCTQQTHCNKCLFGKGVEICDLLAMKWLVAEAENVEPQIDWSTVPTVPIDTPVLVSEDGEHWYNRYFAGTNANNKALVYANGMTSWTAKAAISEPEQWLYIKLAELPDPPENEE